MSTLAYIRVKGPLFWVTCGNRGLLSRGISVGVRGHYKNRLAGRQRQPAGAPRVVYSTSTVYAEIARVFG